MLPGRPIAFLWHYVRRRPGAFGALLALIVAASACAMGVQYGMKLIVDTMASEDRTSREVWRWLAMFIVLIGAESAFWRLSGWLGCLAVVRTGVDVRLDLFRHLSGHSLDYFSRHLAGSLGNRITATAGATGAILGTLIWKILPPCVDFIGAVVVLCTIDIRMALTLIAFVGVVAGFMYFFGLRVRPLQQAFAEKASQVGGEMVDVVSNIFTVMAFSAREREYRRLREAFGIEARAQRRSWLFLEKARAFHDLCMWLMAGAMLVWAVEAWRAGDNMAGDVVLVSALTFRILHGSRELALSLVEASQHFGVIAEMLGVVAVPHDVADPPSAPPFAPGAGAIVFHDVGFAYNGGRPIFEHLDLAIPAGQRLGVVGPSGAGKSTFIRLIGRIMDPTYGRIMVDGTDISQVRQDSLRDAIGVVPQEVALFHRSVMENLRYGSPDASNAQVVAAARHALCDDFIRGLPQGYDTVVGSAVRACRAGSASASALRAPC